MSRAAGIFAFAWALCLAAGCSVEHDARSLIQSWPGPPPERPAWIEFWGQQKAADGAVIGYWGAHRSDRAVNSPATTAPSSLAPGGGEGAGRGTVLFIHPYLTDKSMFAPLARKFAAAGWDVVLVDVRGHGESADSWLTWGVKEKDDFKRVMDTVIARNGVSDRIFAFGASMGGCIAIQYAAYDSRCRGVMALAPPKSFEAVARLAISLRDRASLQERIDRAGQIGGFDPKQASAVDAAARLRCPLIVVHGRADLVVPFEHGEAIYNAAPEPKRLIALPWVGHVSVQVGRDDWLIARMDELDRMARGNAN